MKTLEILNQLFPICRSITGNGLRKSFEILGEYIPLKISEIPTGTQCFDWNIPREWNIRDAYLMDLDSNTKVIDFSKCNLHVVNYSVPINTQISFKDLQPHLHYIKDQPTAIPYRTSYYKDNWGFCLSYDQFKLLRDTNYQVYIDSTLTEGSLTYGEINIGNTEGDLYLLSTYLCHPSMANDNLSGPLLLTAVYERLKTQQLKNNYHFIFVPETIGSLAWLSQNTELAQKAKGAMVFTTCAGNGIPSFKKSFKENSLLDRAANHVLKHNGEYIKYDFFADGSDERQYSSPGFRIPTISLHNDKYYEYKEYHTSLDDLDFFNEENFNLSIELNLNVINILEKNCIPTRTIQYGEIQLGKRGLYPTLSGSVGTQTDDDLDLQLRARTELLFWADGSIDLLEIADKCNLPFDIIYSNYQLLKDNHLF